MPSYPYPRPALTVDAVVFGWSTAALEVMLIRRGLAPFKGRWALPGGFVHVGESPDGAVRRELREETGLADIYLEQLATFGEPDRDPREHTVTVAYFALVDRAGHDARADTDAADAAWHPVAKPPPLAFDHRRILDAALERLRGKVRYQPIGFELLPDVFPLRELQRLYETILGRPLDKRNFRKKVLSMGILRETDEFEQGVTKRPARLYGFDRWAYDRLVKKGFHFEL